MNRATKALLGTVMLGLSLLGLPPASSVRAGGLYMPCTQAEDFKFTVTIVNASDNSLKPLSFAPGVWALHARRNPLLQPGLEGRQELAQEGDPAALAHALAATGVHSRIFYADRDHDETGFLLPGDSYAFTVQASTHTPYLSFALFMSANDWFISPDTQGIALVNAAGGPRADGDITDRLRLWHASTDAQEVTDDDAPAVSDLVRVILARARPTVVDVSIKNVSGSLALSFAPGIFAAHTDPAVFYAEGHPRLFAEGRPHLGNGLEALAEDGDPNPIRMFIATAGYMAEPRQTTKFGIFDTPVDRREPGPLLPGSTYAFTVITDQGAPHLSLALMLRPSNDWFVATPARGVSLFHADGTPIAGAIPVHLYDAGTEEDEPFAAGAYQLPRQPAPNSGPADDETAVRRVEGWEAQDWLEVTVTPRVTQTFGVSITNVSTDTPLAPGLAVSHRACDALFSAGMPDRGAGLEALAEDGAPETLAAALATQGLSAQVVNQPLTADRPSLLQPGETYAFSMAVHPVAPHLSLAFMHGLSNDLFVGTDARGIRLWDALGHPIAGDVTAYLRLWDAGTERNQPLGSGSHQLLTQNSSNAGADDPNNAIRPVPAAYDTPALSDLIRVVVTPQEAGKATK